MQVAERLRSTSSARHRRDVPEWLGRAGLVGRGVLYLLVGWLAVRLAFGDRTAHADQKGALAALAHQPFGRWLVIGLGVLFLAYAAYRFTLAVLDPEDDGIAKRLFVATRGIVYLALAWGAFGLAMGRNKTQSSGEQQRDWTLKVLNWPAGRWIVAAIGVGVIGVGLYQGWQVASGKFADDLKKHEIKDEVQHGILVAGTAGCIARMIAFGLAGAFLVHVGWAFDPASPIGLDQSLAKLRDASWGPIALVVVGAGLAAYGLFTLARARYERIFGQ